MGNKMGMCLGLVAIVAVIVLLCFFLIPSGGGDSGDVMLFVRDSCPACKQNGPKIKQTLKEMNIPFTTYDTTSQRNDVEKVTKANKINLTHVPFIYGGKHTNKLKSHKFLGSWVA